MRFAFDTNTQHHLSKVVVKISWGQHVVQAKFLKNKKKS